MLSSDLYFTPDSGMVYPVNISSILNSHFQVDTRMGTLVETDIDQFIKGHKAKLQEERRNLNEYSVSCSLYFFVNCC